VSISVALSVADAVVEVRHLVEPKPAVAPGPVALARVSPPDKEQLMAWTQSDIDILQAAITSGKGAKSITFADQSVSFHSIDEMLKLLAVMRQEVLAGAGGSRTRYASIGKGFV
jgi:hypothetical protein